MVVAARPALEVAKMENGDEGARRESWTEPLDDVTLILFLVEVEEDEGGESGTMTFTAPLLESATREGPEMRAWIEPLEEWMVADLVVASSEVSSVDTAPFRRSITKSLMDGQLLS